mgnify:CR=1 FL=1
MHSEQDRDHSADTAGHLTGQSLDHFDPIQGLFDNEEKAEALRNMRYGFRVGAYNILINSKTLCEVVKSAPIYRMPNTPLWVFGVINLRGNIVPVFDFVRRLDPETAGSEEQELLVLEQGEQALGIYIDGLPCGLHIDPEDSEQQAAIPADIPASIKQYVSAAYRIDGSIWLEVNHRELFADFLDISVKQSGESA